MLLEVIGPPRIVTPADAGVAAIPNYGEALDRHPVDAGRLRHVIERVTERAGWTAARAAGRALGLAAHRSFVAYVGAVVSVVPDRSRRGPPVRADEVWITIDAGRIANRDRVRAQMEGAVIFGLSLALHGAITAHGGAIEQTNFRDYPIVRLPEAPRAIHVEIVESDRPPSGVGEPGVPPIAPALMNAVFALTGVRVRDLPLARAGLTLPPR
jgi:isoquinoline 1-oxidoreductase beta subunit